MMKLKIVSALFGMILTTSFVVADYSTLIPKVAKFNTPDDGQEIPFTIQTDPFYSSSSMGNWQQGENWINVTGEPPNLEAFSSLFSGNNGFQTFYIPSDHYGDNYSGTLNFTPENGGYYTTNLGLKSHAITKGTAILYRLFATGELQHYDYVNAHASDAAELQAAIWKLQGYGTALTPNDWSTNRYLAQLLDMNPDVNAWLDTYDPTTDTSGYAVFATNNTENTPGKYGPDFLYILQDSPVPEPATLCLWGIGLGTGLIWRRWKNRKKEI